MCRYSPAALNRAAASRTAIVTRATSMSSSNGIGGARPSSDGLEERLRAGALALVLPPQIHLLEARPAEAREPAEIVEPQNSARRKNLEPLFRDTTCCRSRSNEWCRSSRRRTRARSSTVSAARRAHGNDASARSIGAAGEKPQQVDEVARFADDPPAADRQILRPMLRRNRAGVDRHDESFGLGAPASKVADAHDLRSEAPIEADHEHAAAARRRRPSRYAASTALELVGTRANGFSTNTCLPARSASHDERRMRVVPRRDHDARPSARRRESLRYPSSFCSKPNFVPACTPLTPVLEAIAAQPRAGRS